MKKFNTPGDIHFVSFNTFNKQSFFKNDRCCDLFLENLDFYRDKYGFKVFGYCIMPDHVHLLIYFEDEGLNISKIIQAVKGMSAKQIINYYKLNKQSNPGSQEPLLRTQFGNLGYATPVKRSRNLRMEQRLHITHVGGN